MAGADMYQIQRFLGQSPIPPMLTQGHAPGVPTAEEEALQAPRLNPFSLLPLLLSAGNAGGGALAEHLLPALTPSIKRVVPTVMPDVIQQGFRDAPLLESRASSSWQELMTRLGGSAAMKPARQRVVNNEDWAEWARKTLRDLDKGHPFFEEEAPNVPGVSAFRHIPKALEDPRYPQDAKAVGQRYSPLTYLYRDQAGKPLAGLEMTERGSDRTIERLAADPASGIAGQRAAMQLLKEAMRLTPQPDEDISPYTAKLLQNLAKRMKGSN